MTVKGFISSKEKAHKTLKRQTINCTAQSQCFPSGVSHTPVHLIDCIGKLKMSREYYYCNYISAVVKSCEQCFAMILLYSFPTHSFSDSVQHHFCTTTFFVAAAMCSTYSHVSNSTGGVGEIKYLCFIPSLHLFFPSPFLPSCHSLFSFLYTLFSACLIPPLPFTADGQCVCHGCFQLYFDGKCVEVFCEDQRYNQAELKCEDNRPTQKTAFFLSFFLFPFGAANFYIGRDDLGEDRGMRFE